MSYPRVPLDDELVGMVMVKLSLTYGHRFTRNYDASPDTVRAHWAHELAGVSEAGVLYALAHLPTEYPPNVLQFRMLATNRPDNDQPRLAAPQASPAIKQEALHALAGLREAFTHRQQPLAWAERIAHNPQGKSRAALELAAAALKAHGRIP